MILDCILDIQPKDSSAGLGETREDFVNRLAGEMLDKLPDNYVPFEVAERVSLMGGALQPMNIFLRQELDRMQKLLQLVRHCLFELRLAISGTIVMNETLRATLDCLYDAKIPSAWFKVIIYYNNFVGRSVSTQILYCYGSMISIHYFNPK